MTGPHAIQPVHCAGNGFGSLSGGIPLEGHIFLPSVAQNMVNFSAV